MSKKAKKILTNIKNVNLVIKKKLFISGKLGSINKNINLNHFYVFKKKNNISILPKFKNFFCKLNWCTYSTIINNCVYGVNCFFKKKILLKGIEFKFSIYKNKIKLGTGFSHLNNFNLPKDIFLKMCKNNKDFYIYSTDNVLLGDFGFKIKKIKKYNIYKDKGIKYFNEKILLKEKKKK
ncbi:hypothetical protein [Candidatus Vidania fulgoroideorum]